MSNKYPSIKASYEHVVMFDWMLQELQERNPDVDPEVLARIAADTWFHIISYFPMNRGFSEDGHCGLYNPAEDVSPVLHSTAGDDLDYIMWEDE